MSGRERSNAAASKNPPKVIPSTEDKIEARGGTEPTTTNKDAAVTPETKPHEPIVKSDANPTVWKYAKPSKQAIKPQETTEESVATGPSFKPAKPSQQGISAPSKPGNLGHARARNATLLSGRYAINAYIWRTGGQTTEATGSILSQSLNKSILSQAPGKYAGDISLGQLRKVTPGMSSFSRIHRFCTANGTVLSDETISLDDYLALDINDEVSDQSATDAAKEHGATPAPKVPKLSIYYRSPPRVATAGMDLTNAAAPALNMGMTPFAGAVSDGNLVSGGTAGFDVNGQPLPPTQSAGLTVPPLTSMIGADRTFSAAINNYGAAINNYSAASVTAGQLTEEQWNIVLRNCAVFYGWKVDRASGQIKRAPRAAFQLRSKIETELVAQIPTFAEEPPSVERSKAEANNDEFEQSLFLPFLADRELLARAEQQDEQLPQPIYPPQTANKDQIPPKPIKGIPNFRVNDDSRIEITACQDTLAVSLAKSDFSSQATEMSASGGAYGVTAGANAGFAKGGSKDIQTTNTHSTQTLVARYLFPRCDLFLRAEDLEPTPEFITLLNKAKYQKSIDAVRAIHEQYGQLFCQELTLGARLLSTKYLMKDEWSDMEKEKQQMKISVGASVQTQYGGGSVQHNQESGSGTDDKKAGSHSQESNVFEAVGGDTILANNPAAWTTSVASPNLWRVVSRDGLSSMIDMISMMPGYEKVQSWFMQAVPAVNKYIRLDAGLSVHVRFKVQTPTHGLSMDNDGTALFYMGFKPASTTTPRLNGQASTSGPGFWDRVDYGETHVLFNPASFRAPCLHGLKDFSVGGAPFGTVYNEEFADSQWDLIAPFGDEFNNGMPYELKNGSRVVLRTVPFPRFTLKTDNNVFPIAIAMKDGKPELEDHTPPPSHMVVIRNAQGVFVPAISDRDEYQYWRVEKTSGGVLGEPIKGGDSVRLCWKFADQATGFRDYMDDVFGRRRNQCPPELETSTLYLKVPWPRFEGRDTPTAMVMSTQSTTEVTREVLATIPGTYAYTLQDLQFRIDTVERGGLGDSGDYMLASVSQEVDTKAQPVLSSEELYAVCPRPEPSPIDQVVHGFVELADGIRDVADEVVGGIKNWFSH